MAKAHKPAGQGGKAAAFVQKFRKDGAPSAGSAKGGEVKFSSTPKGIGGSKKS
jgi:hypothetical protein